VADTLTVVTERTGMVTDHQAAGVSVVLMAPWQIILVRALRVYLQTLVGLLTALGTGAAATVGVSLSVGDFWHLLLASASIAVAPSVMSVLLNTIELLAKIDATNPQLRG
jgi:hypothetical protein